MSKFSSTSDQLEVQDGENHSGTCTDEGSENSILPASLERVDLQELMSDKTLSIHKQLFLVVAEPDLFAKFRVIDLAHVYIDADAKAALNRCYITPAFLLSRFGAHYAEKILAVGTRGKLKGMTYVNSSANAYLHSTDDGVDIVVSGVSGERDGKPTREVHISCAPSANQTALSSVEHTP